jgi:hypothetical protein
LEASAYAWISLFDDRPGRLFEKLEHIRVAICINCINVENNLQLLTTNYIKFSSEYREYLFSTITYGYNANNPKKVLSKTNTSMDSSIMNKVLTNQIIVTTYSSTGAYRIYYHNAPQYFIRAMLKPPYFWNEREGEKISVQIKSLALANTEDASIIGAILNSSLFYWWFVVFSDCRHLTNREINSFTLSLDEISFENRKKYVSLFHKLNIDLENKKSRKHCIYKATGKVVYDEYYPRYSKPIIDEIDAALAKHYEFTEEELDFITNYDIKYRMGDNLE